MLLLYVPAGNFLMGSIASDPKALANEQPQHTVYLDAFWIDQTDVTNAMYAKCVSAGACNPPAQLSSSTHSSYYGNSQFDNYPVINVTWDMANIYCSKWAGRQLPTEAQWEKAARGPNGNMYPWGNNAPNTTLLNYYQNVGDTTEVGKYPNGASPYGALDMAGNVWQWVADWYQSGYYATLGNNASNPQGPASGDVRVLRGGSWNDIINYFFVRSALRGRVDPTSWGAAFGFRCSRSQ
jgi:serine/threonine-protein kinase